MITAKFRGGPIDGQTKELPYEVAPLYVYVAANPLADTGPMSLVGKERYELDSEGREPYVLGHVDDKKRLVHYYLPSEIAALRVTGDSMEPRS